MSKRAWILALGIGIAAMACDKGSAEGQATAAGSAAEQGLPGGKKHDPPIEKDDVPAGHWYCDMGTVHYTRPDKGDGKCSLCGMKLHEKK